MDPLRNIESQLMTIKEVAPLLPGRTEGSLRWHIHNGTAPPSAVIMGRRVFRRDQVMQWIEDQFNQQNTQASA